MTPDQVLQLSPDQRAFNNGKRLGVASKWGSLGTDGTALWGEIKGSGKKPYQTRVDLANGFAAKCTCSSRKLPCKHAIGLMLIHAQTPADMPTDTAPEWVEEWIKARTARLTNAKSKTVNREEQAKRAAKRQANITAGLQELDLWIRDLVRAGFATLPGKPRTFYEKPAKRLIDAQAPAAAERVQYLSTLPSTGDAWVQNMLVELAQLNLMIQGFRRFEALPTPMQADLRTAVGWAMQANELTDETGVTDQWFVLGRIEQATEKLRVKRTWLCGMQTGSVALLLDFAFDKSGFPNNHTAGDAIEAELVFYPSAYPQRATIRTSAAAAITPPNLPGYATFTDAINNYADAVACNPWLEHFPAAFVEVIPVQTETGWQIVDTANTTLPLSTTFESAWELFALSGGSPVWLFGEWDGVTLLPLAAAVDERITSL